MYIYVSALSFDKSFESVSRNWIIKVSEYTIMAAIFTREAIIKSKAFSFLAGEFHTNEHRV